MPVRILFLFLLNFCSSSLLAQYVSLEPVSSGEVVKHSYYMLSYSEPNEQAEWIYYKLTDNMLTGSVVRTDNFKTDILVSSGSADPEAYTGSGYDRGHLCPAGDMAFNLVAMSESFYMSNMSPQAPGFNRGIWKKLEGTVRNWAKTESEIHIVTGPVFRDNLGKLSSGVTIPGHYYKVVYDPTNEQKMIGLILPNIKGERQLEDYAVSVDYVESVTGIDFFAGLPDELENSLESHFDCNLWEFKEYNVSSSGGGTSVQCKGIAKSTGQSCRNKTTNENGYCHLHQSQAEGEKNQITDRLTTSVQCKGHTKTGNRCKNKTLNSNEHCHLHQAQVSTTTKGTSSIEINKTTRSSSSASSRVIYTGPRGGKYYINSNGSQVYIKK